MAQFSTEPYAEANAKYDALQSEMKIAGMRLDKYPRGPMGLTPDEVKNSSEWREDKRAFDEIFARVRAFNAIFARSYKKEIRAARRAKYGW